MNEITQLDSDLAGLLDKHGYPAVIRSIGRYCAAKYEAYMDGWRERYASGHFDDPKGAESKIALAWMASGNVEYHAVDHERRMERAVLSIEECAAKDLREKIQKAKEELARLESPQPAGLGRQSG